jgi:ribosome-binding protein aMBF1 (putative translation factor)
VKAEKRKKLEAAGFRVGNAEDLLELTPEEQEMVRLRLRLSRLVRAHRERQHLTQQQLAERIASSQSRVAKLESGAGGVSLDLLFRGFFAVGGKLREVTDGKKIGKGSTTRAKLPSRR